jgi:demethylmenaquinone methyltransferase / 2-methoxy-6-polyprenyl-1,4-benzoquinol methylase
MPPSPRCAGAASRRPSAGARVLADLEAAGTALRFLFLQDHSRVGQLVTQDADSYRYLSESIRVHPGQEELKAMMEGAGLEKVEYFNLALGVVALHRGYKF